MHGGKCCGIKTIYGFSFDDPSEMEEEVSAKPAINKDQFGHHVSSDLDFFTDAAPEETQKKRLDRLIKFCEKHRPRGIIEVTLADSSYESGDYNQLLLWKNILHRRKFKIVNKCKNSNSGNTVYVFHRNSGEQ
jgi:hypothetical protein